jgi:predicted transcriptional regulator
VLNVTRPTIYAWLEGQEPKSETLQQISRLVRISEEIKKYSISRMDTFLHRPILNNNSLLDKLKAGEDIAKFLGEIKILADKEAANRKKIKGSGKKIRSSADVIREYSNPLYKE